MCVYFMCTPVIHSSTALVGICIHVGLPSLTWYTLPFPLLPPPPHSSSPTVVLAAAPALRSINTGFLMCFMCFSRSFLSKSIPTCRNRPKHTDLALGNRYRTLRHQVPSTQVLPVLPVPPVCVAPKEIFMDTRKSDIVSYVTERCRTRPSLNNDKT